MLSPAHSDSPTGISTAVYHLQCLALNVKNECRLDDHIRMLTGSGLPVIEKNGLLSVTDTPGNTQ